MNNMKKVLAMLAVMAVSMSAFAACGGGAAAPAPTEAPTEAATEAPTEAETEEETEEEAEEEEETEEEAEEETVDPEILERATALIDAVTGTVLCGMHKTTYDCLAMKFDEGAKLDMVWDDGTEFSGYWDITLEADTLMIYSDEELTDMLGSYSLQFDEDSQTIILDDSYVMTEVDEEDAGDLMTVLNQMATAKKVAEALNGTYWYGADDTSATVIKMDGELFTIADTDNDGNQTVGSYYWGLTYDNLTLYDANYMPVMYYGWNAKADLSTFTLINEDGSEYEMTQITEQEACDYIQALNGYSASVQAENEAYAEDDDDDFGYDEAGVDEEEEFYGDDEEDEADDEAA